jgi:C-terminal processing protease CtpA/Prc
MLTRTIVAAGWLLWASSTPVAGQDLVPAGSIVEAARGENRVIVAQDHPDVRRHAEAMQKRFFREAELIGGEQAAERSLAGRTLIVYGTPAHAWLEKYKERLPFRYEGGAVLIVGQRFEGEHLRLICAVRNPEDPQRRAVLYTAAKEEDIPGINSIFHGPTEWLVADGTRILAARWFAGAPLAVEHLLADLDELAARIRSVHPAAVDGLPPEVADAIERGRGQLAQPLPRRDFWLVLSRVLNALHDAHSSVDPPRSGEELALPLLWTGEGIMISEDAGPLRTGDRIVRLAAHTESQLLDLLRGVVSAENDYWVRHRGESMLRDLAVLRTLGIFDKAPVPLVVEREGNEREVSVPLAVVGRSSRPAPWVRFEIDEKHDLGVFVLDQCINNELYRKTLEQFFAEVREKNIGRIAIDVRRNSGGNSSVLDELLRYLDVETYTRFGGVIRWSPEARAANTRRGNVLALLTTGIERHAQRPVQNRRVDEPFRGKVFILTSKATFSSGNWFAVVVQDNHIGQVVGEPTGNAPSSYGDQLTFTLTHSGLTYRLSYKQWLRPDPKRDPAESLVPDRMIATTRRDLISGRDAVLEFLRSTP